MRRLMLLLFLCAVPVGLAPLGCGAGSNGCTPTGFLFVAGPSSTANLAPDHMAKAPGSEEQLQAGAGAEYGPGCATPQVLQLVAATWTSADPDLVQVSSAADATNGLVTCLQATPEPVNVNASLTQDGFTETKAVPITCK